MAQASPTTAGPGLNRRRSTRSVGETAIKVLLAVAAVISVLTTTGIVIALLRDTIKFFGEVGVGEYLFGTAWAPLAGGGQQSFGVVPLIYDTLYLTAVGLLLAVPLGLGSAIYLSEYLSLIHISEPTRPY